MALKVKSAGMHNFILILAHNSIHLDRCKMLGLCFVLWVDRIGSLDWPMNNFRVMGIFVIVSGLSWWLIKGFWGAKKVEIIY